MQQHMLETRVEGFLTSLFVSLEGFEIGMAYDGIKTYRSTDLIEIDGALNLTFHGVGIAFAKWKISVGFLGDEAPFFERSGRISIDNESIVKEAILIPEEGSTEEEPL